MLAAFYSVPTSLFRIYGGVLSDRSGARAAPYWTFGVGIVSTSMLSYPPTTIIDGIRKPIRLSTRLGLTKRGGREREPIPDPGPRPPQLQQRVHEQLQAERHSSTRTAARSQ